MNKSNTPTKSGKDTHTYKQKEISQNAQNAEKHIQTPITDNTSETVKKPLSEAERLMNLENAVAKILNYFDAMANQPPPEPSVMPASRGAEELMNEPKQTSSQQTVAGGLGSDEDKASFLMGLGNAIGNKVIGEISGSGGDQNLTKIIQQKMYQGFMEDLTMATDIRKAVKQRLVVDVVKDTVMPTKKITPKEIENATQEETHQVGNEQSS